MLDVANFCGKPVRPSVDKGKHHHPMFNAARKREAQVGLSYFVHECFAPFDAVDDASVNIGEDEEDHAAKYGRDEEFIEEVDVIDNGIMFGAGFVVTHPRGGEIGCCIWMAALAFDNRFSFKAMPVCALSTLEISCTP